MARPRQSGLHDPYWYEATFAERFIVEMLDADSGIQSVTMQSPDVRGFDDVVVKHQAKPTAYYQIKHTRSGDTLSFADLTAVSDGASLLGRLAEGWAEVTRGGGMCETHLWTNRALAVRSGRPQGAGEEDELPALDAFWSWLQEAIAIIDVLDDVHVADGWNTAWQRWLAQLHALTVSEKLLFLKALHLDAGEPGLPALEQSIRERLAALFGVPEETAQRALAQLDHHLREWATSERGANVEITAERALNALSLGETERIGDHAFAPPAPFFPSRESFVEKITTELRASEGGVFFLTGPAGCGKSSVVSALANRAEPVIDLRFHAFRPLTPHMGSIPEDAGRAVTAVALWGDLLVQLRTYFFAGRLWENSVPVRNDFLQNDPTRLREHVLRLAVLLAKERQRPTVIAIDGLDHAARARHLTPEVLAGRLSLLASLIPPDEVPPGVVFLIAGQPGWDGYPAWLRAPRSDVHPIDVPPINVDDIAALIHSAPGSSLPLDQIDAAARVIADLTNGNTLPAVYAVAETQMMSDTMALQAHLADRRLGGSLEEYYNAIWSAALGSHYRPATSGQLATALALSTARLTPQLLTGFFSDAGLSSADWQAILVKLAPIVDAVAGTYAIRHNDLRVFLMAQLQGDRKSLVNAASAMGSFYLTASASDAKHADLLRLLDLGERKSEIPAAFSPNYVADAIALHRPIAELLDQATLALASVTDGSGWNGIHTFALGLATLQQARTIVEYYSLEQPPRAIPPCLVSEARVLPRQEWSLHAVERLFEDARTLLAAGERDRARALLSRWLGELTPVALAALLKAQPGDLKPWEERDVDERIRGLIRVSGELSQRVGVNRATLRERVTDATGPVLATFYGGWLQAGVKAARPWVRTLQMPPVWYTADVEKCIEDLANDERWADVLASLELRGTDRGRMTLSFRVHAAEWAIRGRASGDVLATWVAPVADGGFAALTSTEERHDLDLLNLYVAVAFVMGYMHSTRPSGGVSDDGVAAYFMRYGDRRREEHVRRLLYAAAWTGQFLRRLHARPSGAALLVQASELAAVVKSLLSPAWDKPAFVPPEFLTHAPRLIGQVLESLTDADQSVESALTTVLLAFAAEHRASSSLEVVWRALAQRGHRDVLGPWMREWIGDEGRVWGLELGERFGIVGRFAVLARETGWETEAERATERLRWNQLGYSGHKDYSLVIPLRWFEDVAKDDPTVWETYGVRILSVSDEASRTGDNRMGIHVDGAVATASALCGAAALWRLASAAAQARSERFVFGDPFMFDGIIGALKTAPASGEALRSLWCASIGALVWEEERGRMEMSHVREALVAAAARNGHVSVPARLREIAAFEYAIPGSSRGFRHPARWVSTGDQEVEPQARDELEQEVALLPIEEAVRGLAIRATSTKAERSSDLWRVAQACGERLHSEHPPNHAECVRTLVEILQLRSEGYAWSFDSFGDAVERIFPLLPGGEQWEFCQWQISLIDVADSPDIWLSAASENLRSLARLHATTTSADDRSAGLDRELRMHESWILGPSDENRRGWPTIGLAPTTGNEPSTWAAFAFQGLLDLLRSRGSARCRAAIKGLYALLADNGPANELGPLVWPGIDSDQRQRLLALLERLAAEHPRHFVAWLALIEEALLSGRGAEQLQSWVTLQAYARVTGEPPGRWTLPAAAPHTHGPIIRAADQLLDVPRNTMGTVGLSYGRSGVRQLAQMFAHAIHEDEDLVEAIVTEHLKSLPAAVPSRDTVHVNEDFIDGEMKMVQGDGVRETIEFLVDEVRAGCFGAVRPSAIAQALLTNDEPRLLTSSGVPVDDPAAWPADDALESLIATGEASVVEALKRLTFVGVPAGERVLAAEVETYSRKHDVVLHFATGWAKDPLAPEATRRPSTFNGRAHLLYGGGGYEPSQSKATGWFTFRVGGLGMFVHSNLSVMPARIWRMFGWSPTPANPLIWMNADKVVARCELLRGPVRDVVQDFLHRQPLLVRWVVSDEALDVAERQLGLPLRQIAEIEVELVRTS